MEDLTTRAFDNLMATLTNQSNGFQLPSDLESRFPGKNAVLHCAVPGAISTLTAHGKKAAI